MVDRLTGMKFSTFDECKHVIIGTIPPGLRALKDKIQQDILILGQDDTGINKAVQVNVEREG